MKKIVLAFLFGAFQIAAAQDAPAIGPSLQDQSNLIYPAAGIEVKPDFPGGMQAFYNYVATNYRMPKEKGLQGKVYMSFVIDNDGSVIDVQVVRDIGFGTGKEAKRVIENSPKWIPGMQFGKAVRVRYTLPITISTR
jgi:protein TonB